MNTEQNLNLNNRMKRLLLIYNPTAGTGKVRAHLGEIVDCLAAQEFEVTLHPTRARGDATAFVRERATEFDRIVCAGGDGTLNEVVSGLLEVEGAPPLGYIPTGTTNDFSHTLELPTNLAEAAACAASGEVHSVDMGLFNGRPFVYIAAFGLFSDVSYTTPQAMKNSLGHLAYVLSGIPQLAAVNSYHMKVEYDGNTLEGDFLYGMVSDTISVGGLLSLNRNDVRINDGRMECLLVKVPQNILEINDIVFSLMQQEAGNNIVAFQARNITFTCDAPVPWTLDGEYGGTVERAEIHALHRAVPMITHPGVQALQNPEGQE